MVITIHKIGLQDQFQMTDSYKLKEKEVQVDQTNILKKNDLIMQKNSQTAHTDRSKTFDFCSVPYH